jgi:hypothetical protein
MSVPLRIVSFLRKGWSDNIKICNNITLWILKLFACFVFQLIVVPVQYNMKFMFQMIERRSVTTFRFLLEEGMVGFENLQ